MIEPEIEEAKPHFAACFALDNRNFKAYFNLAKLLAATGNLPEAESHFRQALDIHPNYAKAHFNLALLLMEREGTGTSK